jgi:hypothetical protein
MVSISNEVPAKFKSRPTDGRRNRVNLALPSLAMFLNSLILATKQLHTDVRNYNLFIRHNQQSK